MIKTCLNGMEYVQSAKRAGIYSYLLGYCAAVQNSAEPGLLPGENVAEVNTHTRQIVNRDVDMRNTINDPGALQQAGQITSYREREEESGWRRVARTPNQKMVSYFSSCLEVLGIQEEVALTEETLKKAYKRAAISAHPDKGGSEEQFEAVTRAYAYLNEILRRVKGGREKEGKVEAPAILNEGRKGDAEAWKHVEPVRLNPKNLDMNAFNRMFEQTHLPDPDTDGYGDWLKTAGGVTEDTPKFGGKFNRDIFNSMFDDKARVRAAAAAATEQPKSALIRHPNEMALSLMPSMGVELGRDRPDNYTAAPNARQQFTDLRAAYTTDATFSGQVANVPVENRRIEVYRAQRESAPVPLGGAELAALRASEESLKAREDARQLRAAEQAIMESRYFDRMKQLVLHQ
jgi:curved DNA-binding protein CbpA